MLETIVEKKIVKNGKYRVELDYGFYIDKKDDFKAKYTLQEKIYNNKGTNIHTIITTDPKVNRQYFKERLNYYQNNYQQ